MSLRCFFSGIESDQHFDACVKAGVRHVLTSFLYLQKKGDMDIVKKRKLKYPHMEFMIDSGAHSFQADYGKYQHWSRQDFDNYVETYCDWLKKNKDYIFCAVELDIDYTLNMIFGQRTSNTTSNSTVGLNIVEGWQKKYFMPLQEKGIQICFCWHDERKLEGWEAMCANFPYVGLSGEMSSNPDFNKFMSVARRYTNQVHGFAATKQADFRDWPWYSVDSITWKTCEMYGTLIHWDKNKQLLTFDQDKSRRALYRKEFEALGLDADGIINDTNYKEVTKYALHSMRSMEEFYENKYAKRIFFYARRLPHPRHIVEKLSVPALKKWWELMSPDTLFKHHAMQQNYKAIRLYLAAIACIQYKEHPYLNLPQMKEGFEFLKQYFSKLMTPVVADPVLFQKEMAAYLSPPNPPALPRSEAAHYIPRNNPPKPRPAQILTVEDLSWDLLPPGLEDI